MQGELESVDKVMHNPTRPFTAIMGGSKVSSKIDIIMNLMDKVDNLILGGGMTYTFKKALGGHVGNSICEEDKLDLALEIMKLAKEKGVNLVLATDTVAADAFDNNANTQIVPSMEIPDGWEGLDVGPESIASFTKVIEQSKTILWNGPVGVFEMPKFAVGTKAIADAIVKATANGAFSLIGVATLLPPSTNSAWPTRLATYPPEAVPCSNTSRGKSYRESRLLEGNNALHNK